MRDLPGPGLKPMSPALAGGFLTTAPPGKPPIFIFISTLKREKCLELQSLFSQDPDLWFLLGEIVQHLSAHAQLYFSRVALRYHFAAGNKQVYKPQVCSWCMRRLDWNHSGLSPGLTSAEIHLFSGSPRESGRKREGLSLDSPAATRVVTFHCTSRNSLHSRDKLRIRH